VEQQVREALLPDHPTVHLDCVARTHERVQLARPTVHAHTARLDQLVSAAARGDSRPGEVGVQAHEEILSYLSAFS
jgi:hypothetical protein